MWTQTLVRRSIELIVIVALSACSKKPARIAAISTGMEKLLVEARSGAIR